MHKKTPIRKNKLKEVKKRGHERITHTHRHAAQGTRESSPSASISNPAVSQPLEKLRIKKPPSEKITEGGKKRGHERIRTAVDGFADHCLATRPRDLIRFCDCKNRHIIALVK